MPRTNEILQLVAENNGIAIDGVSASGVMTVTLKFIGPGFTFS